jgi:hypothetical protein
MVKHGAIGSEMRRSAKPLTPCRKNWSDAVTGAIVLWFVLVALFTIYVVVDIRSTPEATVMKWGFGIVTVFSGPFGALLYVLSCKEPLPRTHEKLVRAPWRQVVGSTVHCVAGDGIGIVTAACVTGLLKLSVAPSVVVEYIAGFLFGWMIFQSLFMKSSMGGSYRDSLRSTILPEFLSMNGVMAGMITVMITWMSKDPLSTSPLHARFWFVMSMALCAGFIVTYPINWWLVSHGLKHGMLTERSEGYSPPRPTPETLNPGKYSSHSMTDTAQSSVGTDLSAKTSAMAPTTTPLEILLASLVTLGILSVGVILASTLKLL